MNDGDRDILLVSLTAYGEASNQGQEGIRAQVWSVINRHNARDKNGNPRWYSHKTLAACVMHGFAFSMWNDTDRNGVRACETPLSDPVMALCISETTAAIAGQTQDPTGGATHYYVAGTKEPGWVTGRDAQGVQVAKPATYTCRVRDHLFYRDVA